jgi:cell division protein ZipA
MPELRFVLIIVGALAIAAILFHGLWANRNEGKAKFGSKPLGKLDVDGDDDLEAVPERAFAPQDDFEIIKKVRKEPDFVAEKVEADPLIDSYTHPEDAVKPEPVDLDIPSMSAKTVDDIDVRQEPTFSQDSFAEEEASVIATPEPIVEPVNEEQQVEEVAEEEPFEVIVLNVHCAGSEPFVGTKLFDSMKRNGLRYGEMDIFHCHADPSGNGKVLFSVANMMQPGTLKHDDPAEFTTKGISFFMTLPCYGDGEQNFKLMLKTAQQIADEMGANVLDDGRNLMTPNRLDSYKAQIQAFKAK